MTTANSNTMFKKSLQACRFWVYFLMLLYPFKQGGGWCYAQNAPADTKAEVQGFWDKLKVLLNQNKTQNQEQQSVTERYAPVYDWIHQTELALYDSLSKTGEVDWNKYQGIVTRKYSLMLDTMRANHLNKKITVFGWHPYWMQGAEKSYRFDLLSYLAWFSYNIDSTGRNDNAVQMQQWTSNDSLVIAAHAGQCKVLLTVTNHTAQGNRALLTNRNLQADLIDDLLRLLDKNKADGIDLNFENIPEGLKDYMTAFVLELSRRLKAVSKNYVLTLDLPAYNGERTCDLGKLQKAVDWFIITGYDYSGPFSKIDGPLAPLDDPNGGLNIRQSVFRYLQLGLKREQLILGLPYYGALWTSGTPLAGQADSTLRFVSRQMYKDIRANHRNQTPQYDKKRWGAYFSTLDPQTGLYQKCWFDDTLTLGRKFDWVLEEQLAGVGIWALGYDNGYPEFWELLADRYAADTLLTYKDVYLEEKHFRLSNTLAEYHALVIVAGIFLVVFLFAGLVVALFDWRVREVFFQNKTMRLLYLLGGIAILLSLGSFYMYMRQKTLFDGGSWYPLGLGILFGVCLTLYVNHVFEKKRRDMP